MMLGFSHALPTLATRRPADPVAVARLRLTQGSLLAGVSFSRASTAMRIAPSGLYESVAANAARLDHDPLTLAPRGLLVEAAATNRVQNGSDLSNASWTRSALTLSGGSVTGPEGSAVPGWSIGEGYAYQDFATTSGAQYATSVWLRANKTAVVGLRNLSNSFSANVNISLTTGWKRFSLSGVADSATSRFLLDNRTAYGYGTSGLEISLWAAQVEPGTKSTSPIITTTTRAADMPGLSGISGTYDVRLIYDDMSTTVLGSQAITSGWWPAQARPHLREMAIFQAGALS
tara:strand:+ start:6996 stop:7862 length:867 start_codon:yes stop_codon:yes gene_type:complete